MQIVDAEIARGGALTALVLREIAEHVELGDAWKNGNWVPNAWSRHRAYDARMNMIAALRDIADMNEAH